MSHAAPDNLGPYRLLNVVNTGQTCQLWKAYHDGLHKPFAVKTLRHEHQRNKQYVAALKWEYQVGADLEHPNVVRVEEYGLARGVPYLAMEWSPSPNMKQWIRKGVASYAHLVPNIAQGAAAGLAYFNEQGWVHRDVKPGNFMVSDQGDVKLVDFALGQRSQGLLARLFSGKSKVQGTRSYISPEQLRGQAVDGRADLYSLACTLFELVSGKLPYTGTNAQELLQKHLSAPVPSLTAANRDVTQEFAELIRRAMAKDRGSRPGSVDDFLEELRNVRVFKRDPTPPRPEGSPEA